jgi:transposase
LGDPVEVITRYVEDITPPKSAITEYIQYRYYCPHCGENVLARSPGALPKCRLGIRVTLLMVYLKYGLHLPLEKIRENLEICFGIKTTKTTIYNHIRLLSQYYTEEFEEILSQIRESDAVYADETGWRIDGVNHWLWAFVTKNEVLFKVDKRRSSDVLTEVLGEDFDGVLISDFFSAYNKFNCTKQKCLVHLLRDSKKNSQNSEEARKFHKKVKRLIKDMAKFKEKNPQQEIAKAKKRFQRRLNKLSAGPYTDPDCIRLAKRLNQHRDSLLTFLEVEAVDYHNNTAERAIRPNVIIRKISSGNRSQMGAETHGTMMTILETHKLRNENFLEEGAKFMRNKLGKGVTSKN